MKRTLGHLSMLSGIFALLIFLAARQERPVVHWERAVVVRAPQAEVTLEKTENRAQSLVQLRTDESIVLLFLLPR